MFKNSEGYADLTAGVAMSRIMKEYRQQQRKRYADKNRRKIYIASKYAGDVDTNVKNAVSYCRRVIEEGHMPIAAHLLYPQILNDSDTQERELGLAFGLALLALCDAVWVFGDVSAGVSKEIETAKRLGKPLRYFEGETL